MDISQVLSSYQTILAAAIPTLISAVICFFLNKKVERLKHRLQKDLIGYQTKYETFYAEQMVVVKTMHEKLTKLYMSVSDHYLATENMLRDTTSFSEQTSNLIGDARRYFENNSIYFDDNTRILIEKLIKSTTNANIDLKVGYIPPIPLMEDMEESQLVTNARSIIKERLPNILEELRSQFRNGIWPT